MFVSSLSRPTQRRLLVCLLLLSGLLAVGTSVLPASGQQRSVAEEGSAEEERYPGHWWVTGGFGVGIGGVGIIGTGGVPVAQHVFVGGRLVYSEEVRLVVSNVSPAPAETTWGLGPLVGVLLKQGQYWQLSLASGVMAVGGRRRTRPKPVEEASLRSPDRVLYKTKQTVRVGVPLNAQFLFTPLPYLGIGLGGGFTVIAPGATPLADLSLHLLVRIPQ